MSLHLSQLEIGGAKRISRHLAVSGTVSVTGEAPTSSIPANLVRILVVFVPFPWDEGREENDRADKERFFMKSPRLISFLSAVFLFSSITYYFLFSGLTATSLKKTISLLFLSLYIKTNI